jgi:hypothetical protein
MCKNFSCGKLLDKFCFDEYAVKRNANNLAIECGYCRSTTGFSEEVPPYIRDPLSNFNFKCNNKGCNIQYLIVNAKDHIKKCKAQQLLTCLLDCGSKTYFRGVDQMRAHLERDCVLVQIKCPKCDMLTTRRDS